MQIAGVFNQHLGFHFNEHWRVRNLSLGPQSHEGFAKDRAPFISFSDVAGVQQYLQHSPIVGP